MLSIIAPHRSFADDEASFITGSSVQLIYHPCDNQLLGNMASNKKNNFGSPSGGLRQECLPFRDILAQSIANIAPTLTATLNAPLVFASAGRGTWLTFVFATVGLVLVSLNINQFASRSASPGSLYAYIARGLGSTAGVLTGWALVLAYLFTAMANLCGFANYGNVLLALVGLQPATIFLCAICGGIAWYIAYRDIRLSTVIMLAIEAASVGLILILGLLVLGKLNFEIDTLQLTLQGTSPEGIRLGLVLAVFSYVGFESATALGDEAKNPLRSIPRAVIISTVVSGLFFILISYIQVLAFEGYKTPLNQTEAPVNVLANIAGVGFLGIFISIGSTISSFACSLASINAGARILYSMARHGLFHASIGQAHGRNETPHIAVTMCALLVFLVAASVSMFGVKPFDAYGYLGTIATYGFLLAYVLISIAAPVYLRRQGNLRFHHIVVAVLAVLFTMVPVVGSVYPVPAAPFNVFPYLFLMYLAVGGVWFLMLRLHSPEIIEQMEAEIEAIHTKFSDMKKL